LDVSGKALTTTPPAGVGPDHASVSVLVHWSEVTNPQAAQENLTVLRIPATGETFGTIISDPGGLSTPENREHAQRCANRMGEPILAGLSTENSTCDVDAVRSALGEEQLNFFGYSYRTRLGTSTSDSFRIGSAR
jgi:pimeloyl-ACP methyl ester carboxylesterase